MSRTSDGRTAAVDRVEGQDRCDPKAEKKAKSCEQVIENRAAEFRRSEAPVLSPEQRILAGDQVTDKLGLRAAARRLATTGEDSSIEAQGVASLVLEAPSRDEKVEDKPSSEAEAAALVGAILNSDPQQ